MIRGPPRSTRTGTFFPYTTLFHTYSLCELEGADFDKLLTGAQPPREVRDEPLHVESDRPLSYPRRLIGRRRNGSNFPIEMSFVKMEGAHETHYTAFIRDLTEQDATKARLELRSEERRVGKEWVSTCRSRWSPYH